MRLMKTLIMTFGALALTQAASAGSPSKFSVKGLLADVAFEGENGCLSTFARVFATDFQEKRQPPGSSAEIFGSIHNTCLDTPIREFDGSMNLAPMAFTVNASGTQAVLNATIIAHDFVSDVDGAD